MSAAAVVVISPEFASLRVVTAADAKAALAGLGATERALATRAVSCRFILGQVLLAVQQYEFWREWGYVSWMDFLKRGFPAMSGLEERTASDALAFARSSTLTGMTPEQIETIPTLTHARAIVKQERENGHKALDTASVERVNGTSAKVLTARKFANDERQVQLERIVAVLSQANAPALEWLAHLLESPQVQAYTCGAENAVDFLLGVMTTSAWDEVRETYVNMCAELGPERVAVLAKHQWRCRHCGLFLPLTPHHIVFRSHSGTDNFDNLEPLCAACHRTKHGQS